MVCLHYIFEWDMFSRWENIDFIYSLIFFWTDYLPLYDPTWFSSYKLISSKNTYQIAITVILQISFSLLFYQLKLLLSKSSDTCCPCLVSQYNQNVRTISPLSMIMSLTKIVTVSQSLRSFSLLPAFHDSTGQTLMSFLLIRALHVSCALTKTGLCTQ